MKKLWQAFRRLFVRKQVFRIPQERVQVLEKYKVTAVLPQGVPLFVQIGEKDGHAQYAWAFVEHSVDNTAAFLWFICTPEGDRRKGYARDLISVLQSHYQRIETHVKRGMMSSPGSKLCLSCGFRLVKSTRKADPDTLVWDRGHK